MIDQRTIFEIHRLANEGQSVRKIASALTLNRITVSKYLANPEPKRVSPKRESKLDPFREEIQRLLERDPGASSEVIRQRLLPLGFDGGTTILKEYLRTIRPSSQRRAFIRFEPPGGEQIQVDWGHFGTLAYGHATRKLYCLAMIEGYSRMLYLEFTHCQRQETLHRALLNGFIFFQGSPKRLVVDNMVTAVLERDGHLIRFNEAFLSFLRPFRTVPFACNPRSPHEKGKVEKGAIHYIRHNFFPLRTFRDLDDVQSQADHWRDSVANVRVHATTGERPSLRFKPEAMILLPGILPDCRDTEVAKVHTDFSVRFDANTYTVPPSLIGKEVVVKADNATVAIYFKEKIVATHARSWSKQFRSESPRHVEDARKSRSRGWLSDEAAYLLSLGEEVKTYVERLATTHLPLRKNLKRLVALRDEYGSQSLIEAVREATSHNAYGADYIHNILYQRRKPRSMHPPVKLQSDGLNRIRLEEPSLADFDAFVIKRRKRHE